jgi:hypothetical protein
MVWLKMKGLILVICGTTLLVVIFFIFDFHSGSQEHQYFRQVSIFDSQSGNKELEH